MERKTMLEATTSRTKTVLLFALAGVAGVMAGKGVQHLRTPPASANPPAAIASSSTHATSAIRPTRTGPLPHAVFPVVSRDLGKMHSEEQRKTTFPITNDGQGVLNITGVDVGCGCTKPAYPKEIAPGASGDIEVVFTPQPSWSGKRTKTLTVHTDDPTEPDKKLEFLADLEPPVRVDPPTAVHLKFSIGLASEAVARVIPRADRNARVLTVKTNSPRVTAKILPPDSRDPSRTYRIALVSPANAKPGDFSAKVDITTTDPILSSLTFNVSGEAQSGPVAIPPVLSASGINANDVGKPLAVISVFSRSGSLEVTSVKSDTAALKVTARQATNGRASVEVTYAGGWEPGSREGTIQVHTSDPKYPLLTIPYTAMIWSPRAAKNLGLSPAPNTNKPPAAR